MLCGGLHPRCSAPLQAPATRICLPTQFAQLSLKASRSQVNFGLMIVLIMTAFCMDEIHLGKEVSCQLASAPKKEILNSFLS